MSSTSIGAKQRIQNLDASRGIAMVLVCLSHFVGVYFTTKRYHGLFQLPEFPRAVGMIASPTFVAISGSILGLLFVVQRETFARLRMKLLDRALFTLTVLHVLIACSRLPYDNHASDALKMTFMTDAIGICVILGVLLIEITSKRFRCALGLACFVLAWRLVYLWTPYATLVEVTKEVLVGSTPDRVLSYSVPVLPWFGVYIACTALGQTLGGMYLRKDYRRVEQVFLGIGLISITLSLALRGFSWYLTHFIRMSPTTAAFQQLLLSPWTKLPPGPVYVLFFGGVGMLVLWLVAVANHRQWAPWLVQQLATIGRASAPVFTLQFYVYYTFMGPLHLQFTIWWPLYFVASLAIMLGFARWWDGRKLNSLLSVGLDTVVRGVKAIPLAVGAARPAISSVPKPHE